MTVHFCTTQAEIAAVFALRKRALGVSNLELDDIAGVQQGYTGKILAGVKAVGVMSFQALAGALGFHWIVIWSECEERLPLGVLLVSGDLPAIARHYLGRRLSGRNLCRRRMGKVAPSMLGGFSEV